MILTARFTTAIPRWILRGSACAAVLAGLPRFIGTSVLLALGRRNLTQFKSVLFGEMAKRFSLEEEAELFWQDERTRAKLGRWFFDRPRDLPIVIASASPEFELQYAAKILGVPRLIGTKCDAKTGALIGKNCKGEEKLRRIGKRSARLKSAPCTPMTRRRTARCSPPRRRATSSRTAFSCRFEDKKERFA